jgi:hypothetical protein
MFIIAHSQQPPHSSIVANRTLISGAAVNNFKQGGMEKNLTNQVQAQNEI